MNDTAACDTMCKELFRKDVGDMAWKETFDKCHCFENVDKFLDMS